MITSVEPAPSSPSPPPAHGPLGKVRVRCRVPLWFRVEIIKRNRITGEIVVIELIWCSRNRWARWVEQHDCQSLEAFCIGPFVVAVGLE